jgi:PAS domain S-box-containing protein
MASAGAAAPDARRPAAEAVYEAAFDALPDPAVLVDDAGRIIAANGAFESMFGAALRPGRSLEPVFADDLDVHAAPWRRGGAEAYSAGVRLHNGQVRAAHIRSTALADGARLVLFTLPPDDPRQTAAANLTRLTETFSAPGAGALGIDLVSGRGQVSDFLARILGSPDTPGLDLTRWREALGRAGRTALDEALSAAKGLHAPVRFTASVRDAGDGRMRRLRHDLTVTALDPAGRPARLTGAVSDVTGLEAALKGRDDAERRLSVLAGAVGASAWRFDPASGEGAIEGPLAQALGGPGFAWAQWRAAFGPEAARRLNAAICSAEFGGAVDLSLSIQADGRAQLLQVRGERLASGEIAGFILAADTDRPSEPDSREAAASADMSAWSYDIPSQVLRLSGPVLALLGLPGPEHEIDIYDWRARVPQDDHVQMDRATASLRELGVADVEYRVRAEDGRLVWLNLRGGVSEQGADGQPLRFAGFLTEIGGRKRMEHQIARREQQLADAVDAGLIGIWAYDYATQTQTARGRILDWMGKPRDTEAVTPEDWLAVIHPDDQGGLRKAFAAMIAGAPVERLDLRLKSPDGWRWGRTHGAPLDPGPDGKPRRAAGVITDIHAERAFREALQSEKARFETVYQATPALLHSIDAQGRTIMVSDYWLKRMGHDRDAVIGAPGWAFMDEESAARIQAEIIPTVLERGWVENEPVVSFTAEGERLELRLSAFAEHGPDGAPVAAHGVFSDITDLNLAQRALKEHAEALERTNRELDRFATVASHDLQEPLRKISAFASLLERRLAGGVDPETQQALDFLVDAAGRMRVLIDDLLAYSRASSRALELKPVALRGFMERVLSGLDLQIAEAGAEITMTDLPEVKGDEVLLGLLFQNLIANALKYRREGGPRIQITGRIDELGAAIIEIADNGIGFDMAFAQKIFEPFARLHGREAYSGTGIGLAICQQAAERLGGRIEVRSTPGEGSVFTVRLPLADPCD